jgi:hypothetical protein
MERSWVKSKAWRGRENGGHANVQWPKGLVMLANKRSWDIQTVKNEIRRVESAP